MKAYVYHWSMRPEIGVRVDLRITASNVIIARREVHRFLVDHDGNTWRIERVSRETRDEAPPLAPIYLH